MESFTLRRLVSLVKDFKQANGRDISKAELEKQFTQEIIKKALVQGLIIKYQTTSGKGSKENRYKLNVDWKSLNI